MDKLLCMQAFCAVAKLGSFTRAGERLSTSKVLVSRNVAQLESHLGLRLLQRTTRQVTLTDDGRAYYERCQALLSELEEIEDAITERSTDLKGTLRLALPTADFSLQHLLPALASFSAQYSSLTLDLELSDYQTDLVAEGFDAAIRIGNLADSSLIARPLGAMNIVLCASPATARSLPTLKAPHELAATPWIADSNFRQTKTLEFTKAKQTSRLTPNTRIRVNSAAAVRALLLQTDSIGLVPDFMVRTDLTEGRLVQLLPDWHLLSAKISLVYSHRRHLSLKIQKLYEHLQSHPNIKPLSK